MLEKLFALSERNTTVKGEIIAGLTTFITMAYILFLAPNLLSIAGMDKDAVLIATALGGGIVTIAMGLLVNYPICLAPGVGLLAFYTFTVVLGMGVAWQTALGAVFISGIVFLILTLTTVRQHIVEGIPASMKIAITVGIGLFITIIGLKLSGLMAITLSLSPDSLAQVIATKGHSTPGSSETILTLGNLMDPQVALALFGLVFTALLMARNVQGSFIIGAVVTSILAYATGNAQLPENFSIIAVPDFSKAAFFQLDIGSAMSMGLVTIIFSFTFVELFDSMGTLIGTATKAGIANPKEGKFPGLGKAMTVDAVGGKLRCPFRGQHHYRFRRKCGRCRRRWSYRFNRRYLRYLVPLGIALCTVNHPRAKLCNSSDLNLSWCLDDGTDSRHRFLRLDRSLPGFHGNRFDAFHLQHR